MARSPKTLTHEMLVEKLSYDQRTGEFRWRYNHGRVKAGEVAGCKGLYCSNWYWQIGLYGKMYLAHRLAYFYMKGRWPENDIDHKDGDGLNNKWGNLRDATRSQNFMNRTPGKNKTGYKGVYKYEITGRYAARLTKDYKTYYLGYYATPEEAHAAYCEAAREHFGEYARTE